MIFYGYVRFPEGKKDGKQGGRSMKILEHVAKDMKKSGFERSMEEAYM